MKKKTSVYVDPELWRKFKAKCALKGKSVSQELEFIIKKACRD